MFRKRLLQFLIFTLVSLVGISYAFGAMTCVHTNTAEFVGGARVTLTCTFDTTPGTAVDAVPDSAMAWISRGYVYTFMTVPGATGPTDNSDLAIADADGRVILSAAGNGADVVDNGAVNSIIYGDGPTVGTTNHYPRGDGKVWTITVTNNAVNNSSFELIMQVTE